MNKIKFRFLLFSFIVIAVIISGCGSEKSKTSQGIADFFPKEINDPKATIESEIRTYEGQALYEYIDGGAELYHAYNFVRVATASYKSGEAEFILDIYEFDTPENAYGLYSRIRPEYAELVDLGTEGFKGTGTMDVVKDKCLIRITGYDYTEESERLIESLANAAVKAVSGETGKPSGFSFFPRAETIPATDILYVDSYFGYSFLTHVFCQSYDLDGDTMTLFFCDDSTGDKYTQWFEQSTGSNQQLPEISDIPFDEGRGFLIPDDYYGDLLVGLKKRRLIGFINYSEKYKPFLIDWLNSM